MKIRIYTTSAGISQQTDIHDIVKQITGKVPNIRIVEKDYGSGFFDKTKQIQ